MMTARSIAEYLDKDHEDEAASFQTEVAPTFIHFCGSCEYFSHNRSHLDLHEVMHSWDQAFRCPRCTYSAMKQQDVDQHLINDHHHDEPLQQPPKDAKEINGLLTDQTQLEILSETRWNV